MVDFDFVYKEVKDKYGYNVKKTLFKEYYGQETKKIKTLFHIIFITPNI